MQNELLAVCRKYPSRTLIVCLNSYFSTVGLEAGLPYKTRLEGFSWLCGFQANVVWVAEREFSWYTDQETRLLSLLRKFVEAHGIRKLVLVGMSAGAYAAIRLAAVLSDPTQGGIASNECAISAFALNPQTGFDAPLVERIRSEIARSGWTLTPLGQNPPLLDPCRAEHPFCLRPGTDAGDMLRNHGAAHARIVVAYDRLNPIDRVFAEHLAPYRQVEMASLALGAIHGDGCIALWNSRLFRDGFAASVAVPWSTELSKLATQTQEISRD